MQMPLCRRTTRRLASPQNKMLDGARDLLAESYLLEDGRHRWSSRRILRPIAGGHNIARRIAIGYKPLPTTIAVIPPLLLHPINIGSVV
jgi:hypothetical protein